MAISRRNILIALGGLVGAGGAAVGTGAFTTVSAQRSINVSASGDQGSFLSFIVDGQVDLDGDGTADVPAGAPNYANIPSGSTLRILLNGQQNSASGLNLNAKTTISPLFSVTNNGSENAGFYIGAPNTSNVSTNSGKIVNDLGNGKTISFKFFNPDNGDNDRTTGNSILGSGNALALDSGTSVRVGIKIDTSGITQASTINSSSNLLSNINVVADATAYPGSS